MSKINFFYEKSIMALEFDKFLNKLANYAKCEKTKANIINSRPVYNKECVKTLLKQTSVAKKIITYVPSFSVDTVSDRVLDALDKVKKGMTLLPEEAVSFFPLILCTKRLKKLYADINFDTSPIDNFFNNLVYHDNLYKKIDKTFTPDGDIADSASDNLLRIRREILHLQKDIRDRLDKYIKQPDVINSLQDPIVTIRYDRFVIPVKADNRGQISGLIHDTSQSKNTLFIEPIFVIEANNSIRDKKSKEKEEIEKILRELSDLVLENLDSLIKNYKTILSIDYIFAKAKMSNDLDMCEPIISDKRIIKIKNARHVLINKDEMVPLNIDIGKDYQTVIVTGPNTGGKTVFLKTLGLNILIAKTGMHIPCDSAEIFIFDKVFADIGDEQSIEQSLSTFSSHLRNIKNIIKNASENCLVLFDEIGSGTDPKEGAALAISIISHLINKKCFIAATTHYSELKTFALTHKGVKNASFEFDLETLSPTYRLNMGIPGKSYAFEISKHLGIPSSIIENAKKNIKDEVLSFEKIVDELNKSKRNYDIELEKTRKINLDLLEKEKKLEKQREKLYKNAENELNISRQKARSIIERAKGQSDKFLKELLETRDELEKEKYQNLKGKVKKNYKKLDDIDYYEQSPKKGLNLNNYKEIDKSLKPGDKVYCTVFSKDATVISVSGKRAEIQCGSIHSTVDISSLLLSKNQKNEDMGNVYVQKSSFGGGVKSELDIRGQTILDAVIEIDKFLDNAVLSHLTSVTIIHGKGTGALRSGVHSHLKTHPLVKKFNLASLGEGDTGATIVEL